MRHKCVNNVREGGDIEARNSSFLDENNNDNNREDSDPDGMSADPLDKAKWMRDMFMEEEEGEVVKSTGLQEKWKTGNFHWRHNSQIFCKPVKIDLPNNATPLQVFFNIFAKDLWIGCNS